MTRQLSVKQERFVQEYCSNGGNGTQAALTAGYSEDCADVIASQNLGKLKIRQAIDEWRAQTAERAAVTVDSLTAELEKDREAARENGQINAAIAATGLISKLHGLLAEDRKNLRDPLTDAMSLVAKREKERRVH